MKGNHRATFFHESRLWQSHPRHTAARRVQQHIRDIYHIGNRLKHRSNGHGYHVYRADGNAAACLLADHSRLDAF